MTDWPPRVRNRWSPSMDGLVVLSPPTSPATGHGRTSPTCLPVTDLGPLPYALVWRREAESEPIRALAGIIRDLGPLPALMSSVTLGWDLMPSGPGVAWLYATSRCP